MTTKTFIKIVKSIGWNVTKDGDCIELSQYTNFGQDFSFSVYANSSKDYIEQVYDYYNNYDPSSEALLWCDEFGHGKNGAPYLLKDIIADME